MHFKKKKFILNFKHTKWGKGTVIYSYYSFTKDYAS